MATTGSLRQRLAALLTEAAAARSGCPVSTNASSIAHTVCSRAQISSSSQAGSVASISSQAGSVASISSPATWGSSAARSGAAMYSQGNLGVGSGVAVYSKSNLGVGSGVAVYSKSNLGVGSGFAVYSNGKLGVGSGCPIYNQAKRGLSGGPNPAESIKVAVVKKVRYIRDQKFFIPVLKRIEKIHLSLKRWWGLIKKGWALFEDFVKVCLILSSTVGGVAVFYSLNMSPYEAFGLLQYLHNVKSAELKALVEAYRHTANPTAVSEADMNPDLQAALGAGKTAWDKAMHAAKEAGRHEALADVQKKVQAAKEAGRQEALAKWLASLAEYLKRAADAPPDSC